jgi:hypothetical protein
MSGLFLLGLIVRELSAFFANWLVLNCPHLHYGGAVLLLSAFPEVGLSSLHCLPKIGLVDDVVAVKDGPRFVAANRHGYALGNSGPDHVPNSRPAEVVEDAA